MQRCCSKLRPFYGPSSFRACCIFPHGGCWTVLFNLLHHFHFFLAFKMYHQHTALCCITCILLFPPLFNGFKGIDFIVGVNNHCSKFQMLAISNGKCLPPFFSESRKIERPKSQIKVVPFLIIIRYRPRNTSKLKKSWLKPRKGVE